MAVLKYKDPQGNWQTLDTGSGSVSSVEITELPYGSEPTARITAGVLYIGWPDGVPIDSVITEESDNPVTSAAIYQALQQTPGMAPVQSVNNKTGAVVLDAQDVGAYEKPASGIPASDLAAGVIPAVPVQDVQVDGQSVVDGQGVADILLGELADRKADVIIASASGAVASFSDGANGMPVKSLSVGIEPVQDLHGYDNPWPAGGGVNKWAVFPDATARNVAMTYENGVITLNGTASASYNFSVRQVVKAGTYTLSCRYSGVLPQNVTYRAQLTTIDTFSSIVGISCNSDQNAYASFTISEDMTVEFRIRIDNGHTYSNVKLYPQLELGSTATDFAPYSNICPITGWTGANISHSGADTTNPTVYPITFPTEAGTVYGGAVNPLSGKLIVTDAEIASYNGETLPSTWISDRDVYAEGTTPTIGAQVVYKLAEPVTYDLSSLEVLETLKGVNNIWANTGAVSVDYCADTKAYIDDAVPTVPVQDVQVNGVSVLNNGVAEIPLAGTDPGVVKINSGYGIYLYEGALRTSLPSVAQIKAGNNNTLPLTANNQHNATFYGLAKAAGTDMASSSNPVGTYTDAAKVAIQKMLGIYKEPYRLIKEITITEETSGVHIISDVENNPLSLTDAIVYFQDLVGAGNGVLGIGVNIGQKVYEEDGTFMYCANVVSTTARTSVAQLWVDGGRFFGQCTGDAMPNQYNNSAIRTSRNATGLISSGPMQEFYIQSANGHKLLSGKITVYGR